MNYIFSKITKKLEKVDPENLKMQKIHASETAWVGTEFDSVIDNNGSIDDLYKQAESLVVSDEIALPPHYTVLA